MSRKPVQTSVLSSSQPMPPAPTHSTRALEICTGSGHAEKGWAERLGEPVRTSLLVGPNVRSARKARAAPFRAPHLLLQRTGSQDVGPRRLGRLRGGHRAALCRGRCVSALQPRTNTAHRAPLTGQRLVRRSIHIAALVAALLAKGTKPPWIGGRCLVRAPAVLRPSGAVWPTTEAIVSP